MEDKKKSWKFCSKCLLLVNHSTVFFVMRDTSFFKGIIVLGSQRLAKNNSPPVKLPGYVPDNDTCNQGEESTLLIRMINK